MSEQKRNDLSVDELQQMLYERKYALRQQRLQRLKDAGRIVDVAGVPPPNPTPPPLPRPQASPTGAMANYQLGVVGPDAERDGGETAVVSSSAAETNAARPRWRIAANRLLLLVEVGAVVGLVAVLFGLWNTGQELNQELAQVQQAQSEELALPTPTATPVIGVVVLPSGHKPPVEGRPLDPSEAGDIPSHLLPAINAYVPPPVPTPSAEQAQLIQIPSIGVNHPIVQGDDWEQLKKGVGQHVGSAQPGEDGNLVLAAHNDIFGEIFRFLDELEVGDEIIVSTQRRSYTYVVTGLDVVEPTDVHVMNPTEHASATLISCYPYRVNTQRIIVFADLVEQSALNEIQQSG